MKQWNAILIIILMLVLASVITVGGSLKQASRQSEQSKLPSGDWKVKFEPYRGPGYEQMPVQVVSVGGYVTKRGIFFIKHPILRNNAEKDVDQVVFTCYVYDEKKPDTVLIQQRMIATAVKFYEGRLAAKTDRPSNVEMGWPFSIGRDPLFGSLIKDGKLEGNYRIAVGVSRVVFKDGSEWEMPN